MIPKVIHYCWFGHNPKPSSVQKCINSWRKYCPNYEIIEWNEDNFDINCNAYVKEAYDAKKWSFVTDYARLWIVYNYGGIYFDTDVEVIREIDELLQYPAFFGYEDETCIATGLGFGAEKGNILVECMLEDYMDIHFIKENGEYDLTPCPQRNTKAISMYLENVTDTDAVQNIGKAVLFPKEYFCPLDYATRTMKKTKNTYTIHWFDASWQEENQRILHEFYVLKDKCVKRLGKTLGNIIVKMIYVLIYPEKRKILKTL